MANISKEKEKVFDNAGLQIRGNTIQNEDNFIQISNITQAWVGNIPRATLPISWIVVVAIASLVFFGMRNVGVGFLMLVLAAGLVAYNYTRPHIYGLNIELNSGKTYTFTSKERTFLKKAFDVIHAIVSDGHTSGDTILINMATGTIVNNSSNVSA